MKLIGLVAAAVFGAALILPRSVTAQTAPLIPLSNKTLEKIESAPAEHFSLILRIYWPEAFVLK